MKEIKELKDTCMRCDLIECSIVLKLIEDRNRLVKALEFYAESSNWVSNSGKVGVTPIWTCDMYPLDENKGAGGKKSREALEASKKMWGE